MITTQGIPSTLVTNNGNQINQGNEMQIFNVDEQVQENETNSEYNNFYLNLLLIEIIVSIFFMHLIGILIIGFILKYCSFLTILIITFIWDFFDIILLIIQIKNTQE